MSTELRSPLLDEVLVAHGGLGLWQRCERIDAHLSFGGLAFAARMKRKAYLDRVVAVFPHTRKVRLTPFPASGQLGQWTPRCVCILRDDGSVVQERLAPRKSFGRILRQFRWDGLDLLYFAGYALWNYLSFPFLLTEPGVEVQESSTGRDGQRRRLYATFPAGFPTHSRRQTFLIGDDGRLLRHDYVAEVIGPYAAAANLCLASEQVGGMQFYSKRRVFPRIGADWVLPFPTLVWIELAQFNVVFT